MLLWLAIVGLSAATVAAVGWPLLRAVTSGRAIASGDAGSRAVYADQLGEIEADLARGLIAPEEAEAARIEVSRRILTQAAGEAEIAAVAAASGISLPLRLAVIATVPVVALAIYLSIGSPTLPDRPIAGRQVDDARRIVRANPEVEQLVAQVEARLRQQPEDGRGWEVLGPVYLRLQRFEDARIAFSRAISLLGETPQRLTGLGESAIKASGGTVTDEAREAFEKVAKAEPARVEARFWLALAREQRGELAAAAEEYRAILATAPADAPWRGVVGERLAATVAAGKSVESGAGRGPSESDVAGAAGMSPEARQQMIAGMVDGLHKRLKANGNDVEGWQKLLRAYAVLGDLDKARAALAEARHALANDKSGLGAIEALARDMGLGS